MSVSNEKRLHMYEMMVRIRRFEEESIVMSRMGLMPGRVHPYVGQEAIAAGACAALEDRDCIVSTHRGTGHVVARGADLRRMLAEFMGRATGYNHGKAGPMHFGIPELGVLCTNGLVGSGITVAAGAALAAQLRDTGQVVVCFFGDGAANTGSCHEGMNLSAIWGVPAVFLCENNRYAETMPVAKAFAIEDIASRAQGYGMPGEVVDGNDVEAVYRVIGAAVARAREGSGPSLIEAKTYRIGWHFDGESTHYRTREEIDAWRQKDPIDRYRRQLVREGVCDASELDSVDDRVAQEVQRAVEQAKDDPFPSVDLLMANVRQPLAWEVTS